MEEAPENGKESSHSARANGMKEWMKPIIVANFVVAIITVVIVITIRVWDFECSTFGEIIHEEVVVSTLFDECSCVIHRLLGQNVVWVQFSRDHQHVVQPHTLLTCLLQKYTIHNNKCCLHPQFNPSHAKNVLTYPVTC